MAQRKEYVKFADICISVYVRQQLSEERVRLFADLYTSSAAGTIPPISITDKNVLIDGRHRMQALKYLGEVGCVCEIHAECKDSFDVTILAMRSNVGGAKELTMADVRQTIIRLLQDGYSRRRIVAEIPFPRDLARKLVETAGHMWQAQRAARVLHAVNAKEFPTLELAAKHYSVPLSYVKSYQYKITKKETDEAELSNVGSSKATITHRYYNMTTRMGNYFKKLADRYEAGDFTEAQVRELLAHVLHQARNHSSAMQDWDKRFDVMLRTRQPLIANPMPPKKFEVNEKANGLS